MKRNGCGKLLKKAMSLFLCASLCLTIAPDFKLKADETAAAYVGDVDGNGAIDGKDVTILRRYLAGGWNVTVDEKEADINGDSEINSKDITMLRRYLAGGWGVELRAKASDVVINEESFPDQNFRKYVLENLDGDDDGILSGDEQLDVSDMFCNELDIKDFTGIELFKNLKRFYCSDNGLTSIDLTHNTALEELNASYNRFRELDLSKNIKLKSLILYGFGINPEDLDLTNNVDLTELYYDDCNSVISRKIKLSEDNYEDVDYRTFLQSFDTNKDGFLETEEALAVKDLNLNGLKVTSETMFNIFSNLDTLTANELDISYLSLSGIKIKKLDLSGSKINSLSSIGNGLEELNVDNTTIHSLALYNNELKNLSFKNVPELDYINCDNNKLENLDVSNALALRTLYCPRNNITKLDLSNNLLLSNLNVDPEVEVIRQVPIDESIFDDAVFRGYVGSFDTDKDGILSDAELKEVKSIDVSEKEISSLKGIGCFYYLESLDCSDTNIGELEIKLNSLKALNVSNTKKLEKLNCSSCSLEKLVTSGSAISRLDCYNNNLTELDVTGLPNLSVLACFYNPITQLDLSKNPMLTYLDVEECELTELDIKNNPKLEYLCCLDTPLTKLLVVNNPLLEDIDKDSDLIIYTNEEEYNKANSEESSKVVKETDSSSVVYIKAKSSTWNGWVWGYPYPEIEKTYYYDENDRLKKIECRNTANDETMTATYEYENDLHVKTVWSYSNGTVMTWDLKNNEEGYLVGYTYSDSYGNSEIYDGGPEPEHDLRLLELSAVDIEHYGLDGHISIPYGKNASYGITTSLRFSGYKAKYEYDEETSKLKTITINDIGSDEQFTAEYEYNGDEISKLIYNYPGGNKVIREFYDDGALELERNLDSTGKERSWYRYDKNENIIESYGYIYAPSYVYKTEYGWGMESYLPLENVEAAYTYGQDGALTKMVCKNVDTEEETVVEYEYADQVNTKCTITYPSGEVEVLVPIKIDENTFPDKIFRDYVIDKIDADNNSLLTAGEIKNTIFITILEQQLKSLEGIQYFTSLKILRCCKNELTELDVSKNLALEDLDCGTNKLTSLDVTKNTALQKLSCDANGLTELDISHNPNLNYLYACNNAFTTLDASNNPALENIAVDSGVVVTK